MHQSNAKKIVDRYNYRVAWSEDDESYVARCAEHRFLAADSEESPEAAIKELKFVVLGVIEDMIENNEKVPEPFSGKTYSGKFGVRMPPHLHRDLAAVAAQQGVSLNQLVVAAISRELAHAG